MKKFIKGAIAILSAVAILATVTACDNDTHEHSVSSWTVVREATCTNEGLREGICGICYQTVQESIPVDKDNHIYGDWVVTAPTTTKTGVAVKICSEDDSHYLSFTLPKLGESVLYTSKVTKRPSAISNGISLYTYPHELGDITFETEIDPTDMTVSDAVSLGASSVSHDMIRSGKGTRGTKKEEGATNDDDWTDYTFEYELYDHYTHVMSDDASEYFISSYDDIYGYRLDQTGGFTTIEPELAASYREGYEYYLTHAGKFLSTSFGTENFLSLMYQYAKSNMNNDLKETIKDGVYTFTFGYYNLYGGGTGGGHFSVITVKFTLSESYTIETLRFDAITYENDSDFYDSQTGTWSGDAPFDFNEDGNAYVKNELGLKRYEYIEVTQTERQEGETEVENPYSDDTRFYKDFDIAYQGKVITDETEINLVAGVNSAYDFSITNMVPADSVGDEFTFYYRKYDAKNNYTDVLVNWGTELSVGIVTYLNKGNNTFFLRSNISGELTFVVKTKSVTKLFKVTFEAVPPTRFYPTIYNYNALVGYVGSTSSGNTDVAIVYAGQPLYFKASLGEDEANKSTESYVTTVSGTSNNYSVKDNMALNTSSGEIVSCSVFNAYEAGTYELTLTSTEAESVTCKITVTVKERPDFAEILSGTYSAVFGGTKNTVTVTFGDVSSETVKGASAIKYTVTASVEYDGATVSVICYYYTDPDGNKILSSGYEEVVNAEDMLYSSMNGVIDDVVLNFTIAFNEAYDLTVSHSLGESFGNAIESIILRKV